MDRERTIQEIFEYMHRLRRHGGSGMLEGTGLSRAQAGVLFVIFHHKDITAKQIANNLGVSISSVTQMVEPLAAGGLIVRQADKKDRRVIHITLTAKGRGIVKRLISSKVSALRAALEGLNDKELASLAKLHRKMVDNL